MVIFRVDLIGDFIVFVVVVVLLLLCFVCLFFCCCFFFLGGGGWGGAYTLYSVYNVYEYCKSTTEHANYKSMTETELCMETSRQ